MRRPLLLAPLLIVAALTGCADIDPPPAGAQPARYGVLVSWDTAKTGNTVAAENALVVRCGLPASTEAGPGGPAGAGEHSSYVSVPGGSLPDKQTSCLTASALVLQVEVLDSPPPRSS